MKADIAAEVLQIVKYAVETVTLRVFDAIFVEKFAALLLKLRLMSSLFFETIVRQQR